MGSTNGSSHGSSDSDWQQEMHVMHLLPLTQQQQQQQD
jgi:hypothetical protein